MAHTEITLIVDGVLADSQIFVEGQEELIETYVEGMQAVGKMTPQDVEIYSMFHPHRAHEDCECIQYEQSHKPKWRNHDD